MKEHYKLINGEGEHEYTITVKIRQDYTKFIMKRSMNSMWNKPGELIHKITDDGNNVIINNKFSKELNYMEFPLKNKAK